MTYRDYMIESNDNLSWCKPISFDSGSIVITRNGGEITGIFADGEDLDATPENIHTIALRIDRTPTGTLTWSTKPAVSCLAAAAHGSPPAAPWTKTARRTNP